jgi:hypothetical protein
MALFAACRPFFHLFVTVLAGLAVSELFSEAFDLARTFFMALLAVGHGLMSLVIELDAFLHFDDVRSKSSTGKCNYTKCYYHFFHFNLPPCCCWLMFRGNYYICLINVKKKPF